MSCALALGQTASALRRLDDYEVIRISRSNVDPINTSFRNRGAHCVTESSLYKLVMRSDKPEAPAFQDWVTREVLPAVRKDCGYIKGEERCRPPLRQGDDRVDGLSMMVAHFVEVMDQDAKKASDSAYDKGMRMEMAKIHQARLNSGKGTAPGGGGRGPWSGSI
ncbi:hypothetical protein KY465_04310 [Pseudohoeflea sp. DP4N28-3]|uniref:Bro-N domain-containing protein n=1 Tax=Pseudohoeflea coraliihabitans TaxID=2860393 RepID=A0ABS6WN10_9HYPH|nr:hypothetical protein [Pseudohoeflea sp. DP4N28-3]